jgi:predicted NBD/HSP70 family sugar kinase
LDFVPMAGIVRGSYEVESKESIALTGRNPQLKGASSETARDINRSLVLNMIRLSQPVSRADLARLTGLQRSTVSLIVEQLLAEGWIVEGGLVRLPRGRKPRLLMLNAEKAAIIGINIMPSRTAMIWADLNNRLHAQASFVTTQSPARLIATLAARIRQMIEAHPETTFEGIGVSLPGRVDKTTQQLIFAPNLGWRDIDLKAPLERATGLPVLMGNAADACALAEVWAGPFAGVQDLIAVTVSEGIGTGIIANGQLVRGTQGRAGEFGHMCLDPVGPECTCGSRGCWEVYASNRAAVQDYLRAVQQRSGRRSSGSSPAIEFGELMALAANGDDLAAAALDRMAHWLGRGISVLVNGLAPAVVTIVGEVTRAWPRVGPIVEDVVAQYARVRTGTRIVPTDSEREPRLRGTVALVLQKHFQTHTLS